MAAASTTGSAMGAPRTTPAPSSNLDLSAPISTFLVDTDAIPSNKAALTTLYEYPKECLDRWALAFSTVSPSTLVFSGDYSRWLTYNGYDFEYTACQPYSMNPYYSPGVCPSGHTIATIAEMHVKGEGGSPITVWQAGCCRSGMYMQPEGASMGGQTLGISFDLCFSEFSTAIPALSPFTWEETFHGRTSISIAFTSFTASTTTTTFGANDLLATATVVVDFSSISTATTGLAFADLFMIAWQMSDFSLFPSAYAASVAQQIGVKLDFTSPNSASATATPIELQPDTSAASPAPTGLSTGVKVGIALGAALSAILVVAFAIFFLLKRRKRRKSGLTSASEAQTAEMEDQDPDFANKKWFLGGKWRNEAEAINAHKELDSRVVHAVPGPPVELDASGLRRSDE
ncbi:hypothetical protein K458DRAFT_453104 [Lentithecium fluviatile CBS 122367]|uniref:Acid protease n=1 Tax=Lentithecium fluviatile CBS 122367 TaxID=1168545 RepID=A0A6G1IZY5_9PLEO|nr:hypothetical protein K458DRAFT_453104 [Lentithecium fluviatile CBS 122367]